MARDAWWVPGWEKEFMHPSTGPGCRAGPVVPYGALGHSPAHRAQGSRLLPKTVAANEDLSC